MWWFGITSLEYEEIPSYCLLSICVVSNSKNSVGKLMFLTVSKLDEGTSVPWDHGH